MSVPDDRVRRVLVRRGFALEWATLGWNVAGIVVLGFAAVAARSVALAGFGLDSAVEIGASTVVLARSSPPAATADPARAGCGCPGKHNGALGIIDF